MRRPAAPAATAAATTANTSAGRGDPQPGHSEHVDPGEQQHREGRPEVVEHRADHEVRVRRDRGARVDVNLLSKDSPAGPGAIEGRGAAMTTARPATAESAFPDGKPLLDDDNLRLLDRADAPTRGPAPRSWPAGSACPRPPSANGSPGWSRPASSAATASTSTRPRSACRSRPGSGSGPALASCPRSPSWPPRTPQVSECHRISGEDCFLLKVHVPSHRRPRSGAGPVPAVRPDHQLVRRSHPGGPAQSVPVSRKSRIAWRVPVPRFRRVARGLTIPPWR